MFSEIIVCYVENSVFRKSTKLARKRERYSTTFSYQTVGLDERPCCLCLMISASALLLVSHVFIVCRSENSTKVLENYFYLVFLVWCVWCVGKWPIELTCFKGRKLRLWFEKAEGNQQKLLLLYLIFQCILFSGIIGSWDTP